MLSTTSIARVLSSIIRPALMPLINVGMLSSPAEGACEAILWLIVSLMRARLIMHSRITDSATLRKSSCCSGDVSAAASFGSSTRVRRKSCWSSRSSTRNNVDAISRMSWSFATPPCSTMLFSRSISPSISPRNSPSPRTPSVSLIFFRSSSCGTSSEDLFMPVRTKMSSTSLTRLRSSRIAEPTVSMSRALGAASASRACSTCSSPGMSSARLKAARISLMRLPAVDERAT